MKEGWSYKKLGEVARVIHGKNQKEVLSANGQYPIYGSGGTIMGYANDFLCEARTTILGRKGSINNPQFIEERFWNVDTAFGITALPGNNSKFIYYFIKSIDWSKKNTGTTLPSLTQQVVISAEIPVPPLSEQHFIVSRLDSAFSHIDALKANAEKQLNEARKLFHVELMECMKPQEGWEERKLGEVCEVISGQSPEGKYYNTDGQGTPFYQGKKEFSFKYIGEPTMWTTAETKIATKGDLLMSVRAPVGDVNFATQRLCIGRGLAAIRTKEEIDKEYLFYYLVGKKSCIKGKEGVGFASINRKEIMDIGIQYPEDLSAQHSIVSHLDSLSSTIRKLEELQQKTLAECDALKQAMLREVFE